VTGMLYGFNSATAFRFCCDLRVSLKTAANQAANRFKITDSGGIQEETTYLGIPCLTLRPNTERPVTVTKGTNHLCNMENLQRRIGKILVGDIKTYSVPELWDGHTADRIENSILAYVNRLQATAP